MTFAICLDSSFHSSQKHILVDTHHALSTSNNIQLTYLCKITKIRICAIFTFELFSFLRRAHKKFKTISPEKVNHNKNAKLSMNKMVNGIAELTCNPFADRICHVFSSAGDQSGDCTFEDFLDMMSVFSDQAPKSVKSEHAFRIFDFDGDDMLSKNDLKQVIQRLIGFNNQFSDLDMDQLIQNILEEADLDDDGSLSFAEFEHVIDKSSDFTK